MTERLERPDDDKEIDWEAWKDMIIQMGGRGTLAGSPNDAIVGGEQSADGIVQRELIPETEVINGEIHINKTEEA